MEILVLLSFVGSSALTWLALDRRRRERPAEVAHADEEDGGERKER